MGLRFRRGLFRSEVFSRFGSVEEDPEVEVVLVAFELGTGEQDDQDEKGEDAKGAPELQARPEPSCEEEDGEEEKPLWRFEGQVGDSLLVAWEGGDGGRGGVFRLGGGEGR